MKFSTNIIFILIVSFGFPDSSESISFHLLPAVNEKTYSLHGDINIGSLSVTLRDSDSPAVSCSQRIYGMPFTLETSEAIAFAVDLVNRDPNILPNVKLGFIMRGVCSNSPNTALATSLTFLPGNRQPCNDSVCSTQDGTSLESQWLSYDVIGLVSPGYDSLTTMISTLYAVARLPIIGATEVSDALSDKDIHPYFFRIVPPNKYMVRAMLKFMSMNGWSYISIVYQEGSYGRVNYETLRQNADSFGICIATSQMLLLSTDYDKVISNLLRYPRARVVVLFVVGSEFRKILRGINNHNARGNFIFVAGDAIIDYSGFDYAGRKDDEGLGTFVFDLFFKYNKDFYDKIKEQTVYTTTNPWLKTTHEYLLECSFDTGKCPYEPLFKRFRYRTGKDPNLRIDAVLTFARAVHNLLSERCPDARGEEARACITGPLLRDYMKNTTFVGNNYEIKFDQKQDVKGKYLISQLVYDHYFYPFTGGTGFKYITQRNIAFFNPNEDVIRLKQNEPTSWSHLNTFDRIVPWTKDSLPLEIPESVCSRPCLEGEYKIVKDLPCCWECRRCRENERLVQGNTSCEACPQFTWPDPLFGLTTCTDIHPTYPKIVETIPIVLIIFAVLFLLITVSIFVCYVIYRNERVIKASSRELSVIQLVAIFLGYTTIILFQTKPTDIMCGLIFFMFCMSFALLYCPLLVKTNRIARIFRSGVKNEQPRFISPLSQLSFTLCFIIVQGSLCAAIHVVFWPRAILTQLIWSEKMVELSCDLTLPGLASFLGYNIMLVFLCSIFAFMVRKLPDNFNESKFITMCVSTTLLIWLAFVPTYFTADKEHIRVFLLSMALLLNHTVALVLLFMPKIYAVIFLSSDAGNLSNKRS